METLLRNEFEKDRRKIKFERKIDTLSLEVFVDEHGAFSITRLNAENVALKSTTKEVIDHLLPVSVYKNYEGIPIYDNFEIEMVFPLAENIILDDEKIYSLQEVEKTPVFPGCYSDEKAELISCISQNIKTHINNNFNVFINPNSRIKKGKQRINIQFVIDKYGFVDAVKVKAKYKELEAEAERVIKALPKMVPGKHNNKAVGVQFLLPITFNLK